MFSFFYNSLLVVLANRTAEFVIIHGRAILSISPQFGNTTRIFNFKNTAAAVRPFDAGAK